MLYKKETVLVTLLAAGVLVGGLPAIGADTAREHHKQRQQKRSEAREKGKDKELKRDRDSQASDAQTLQRLLGQEVRTEDNQKLGKLNNLALDLESGHVLMAIVGTDDGRIALPPGVFSRTTGDQLRLNINRDKAMQATKVSDDMMRRDELGKASLVNKVHEQFNQQAWWKGGGSASEGKFNNVHTGEKLIGMNVINVMDRNVGEVRNALVDLPAGRIVFVALQPDSEMNLGGNKLYAFPPSSLTLHKSGDKLVTDVTREKLESAPSFSRDNWPSMTDRSFASRVYQYYGKQAYFERSGSGALAPTGGESERSYEND